MYTYIYIYIYRDRERTREMAEYLTSTQNFTHAAARVRLDTPETQAPEDHGKENIRDVGCRAPFSIKVLPAKILRGLRISGLPLFEGTAHLKNNYHYYYYHYLYYYCYYYHYSYYYYYYYEYYCYYYYYYYYKINLNNNPRTSPTPQP